ncbi:hypothetical protein GGF31_002282 [Allomyces arbusculus]|nr:hypothetical protein GGF31_002282 [Allomyces arbusculus]
MPSPPPANYGPRGATADPRSGQSSTPTPAAVLPSGPVESHPLALFPGYDDHDEPDPTADFRQLRATLARPGAISAPPISAPPTLPSATATATPWDPVPPPQYLSAHPGAIDPSLHPTASETTLNTIAMPPPVPSFGGKGTAGASTAVPPHTAYRLFDAQDAAAAGSPIRRSPAASAAASRELVDEVELRRRRTRLSVQSHRRSQLAPAHDASSDDEDGGGHHLNTQQRVDAVVEAELPADEFDWELDGGKVEQDDDTDTLADTKRKRRQCCGALGAFYSWLPFALQCLISALIGDTIIFAALGLPDLIFSKTKYLSDPRPVHEWTSNINIGGMPLLLWACYLMISYSLHWATLYVLGIIPTLLQSSLLLALGSYYKDKLARYIGYVRALHRNLTIAAWAFLSNVLWNLLISSEVVSWQWKNEYLDYIGVTPDDKKTWIWWDYVSRALLGILATSAVWTAKRLVVAIMVVRFQQSAFATRIKRMRFADAVVRKLSAALHQRVHAPNDARRMHRAQTLKEKGLARARKLFARKARAVAANIGNTLLDPTALHSATAIPLTPSEANLLAKNLFTALAAPRATELVLADFVPFFDSEADARRAFRLWDRDGNGDVSKTEMKAILTELMKEKQNLEDSMQDAAAAVGSLDNLFSIMALLLIVFVVGTLFNLKLDFTSAVSLLLPFSFIFGSSLKDVFEGLVFILLYQAYTVGDWVVIDQESYLVKSVSIQTTVMQRSDGRIVHYPNKTLFAKPIDNVRMSGAMAESVTLQVALTTPAALIADLEDELRMWMAQYKRDFLPPVKFAIAVKGIELADHALELAVPVPHKGNWQDQAARAARRQRFIEALREAVIKLGIKGPGPEAEPVPDLAVGEQVLATGATVVVSAPTAKVSVQPPGSPPQTATAAAVMASLAPHESSS